MCHRFLSTAVIACVLAVQSVTIAGVQETTPERSFSTACYDALMNLFGVGDSGTATGDVNRKAAAGTPGAVRSAAGKPWRDQPLGIHIECTITTEMINSLWSPPAVKPRIVDDRPHPPAVNSVFYEKPTTRPPEVVRAASIDPKMQAVTVSLSASVTVPGLSAPGVAAATADAPTIRIFVTSSGQLGDDAFRAVVVNQSGAPITLQPGVVALEPILQVNESDLQRELATLTGFPQQTITLDGYCLERQKAAPSAGTVYRIADAAMQATNVPVGRLLGVAERLRHGKMLEPDTDPDAYYHSIVQWAIWTEQEKFDRRAFETAFTQFMRKSVVAKKQRWTSELEDVVRELVPNRWRDVSRIVDETRKAFPKE